MKLFNAALVFGCAFAVTGCLAPTNKSLSSATLSSATIPPGGGGGGGGGNNAPVTVSGPGTKPTTNLGTMLTIPITITGTGGYTGSVSLALDTKVLSANDPRASVQSTILPASVSLASGSAAATVTLNVPADAPDLDTSVNVVATANGGSSSFVVPFQVMPIYEIDVIGPMGAIEPWTVTAKSTVNFTQHKSGITVKFVNKDTATATHRIHSNPPASGGIPHEAGSLGLPGTTTPNGGDTVGDTYSVTVTNQTAQATDTVYCHQHEATSSARTIVFNAYTAPPVIGQSGNPNASFAYIMANMITPMCASCHVNKNPPDGGINMATYASLMASGAVVAGNAGNSQLYSSIISTGTMPQGNPGSVSAALQKDVMDWINDGAKNN